MHDPVWAAKRLASLDVLSGGRLVAGVGAGARAEDFRAVSAPFDGRRHARMAEQVALMRRIFAGERVVEDALGPVEPLPLQPGGPPLLAGSLSPRAIRRVASWADGLCGFSFGPDPREVEAGFESARSAWHEAGRAKPPYLLTSFWVALGPKGREQLDRYLARYLDFLGSGVASRLAPAVTVESPARLRTALKELEACGADEVSLVPTTLDPDELDRIADALP